MMKNEIEFITSGSVTSPRGFHAGATYAGIKKKKGAKGTLDLGILFSEVPCVAAGVFTTNRIKAAPVLWCQQQVKSGKATAVVANSGCANACTGEEGLQDTRETAALVAKSMGISPQDVLVASTGVIGERLPVKLIKAGIERIVLSPDGGHDLARAIMTTDTTPKEVAVKVNTDHGQFTIGGIAKGAGMIHPDMATMLCFLATDAAVESDFLRLALRKAAAASFNSVSIDGDTSTNDTVLIMANGLAGNTPVSTNSPLADAFQGALDRVCTYLAKCIARDGEGATRLIEVTVNGAPTVAQARLAARTVVNSPLVKSAVHGGDPNWGRIMAAVGRSGVEVIESKIDLHIGQVCLVKAGKPVSFDRQNLAGILRESDVLIKVDLNLGNESATAWGCDLSEEYVTINSEYTT